MNRSSFGIAALSLTWLVGGEAFAQTALPPPPLAPPSAAATPPAPPAADPGNTSAVKTSGVVDLPVVGKLALKLYGFAELDAIYDSTQSFNEIAGNNLIQRDDTYKGTHRRMTFGARNSRLGIKVKSEASPDIHVTGVLEVDFLGNQPSDASEAQTFNNPALRMRQGMVVVETPYVDILAGQTWQLFGWQSRFLPASVQIQGLPGELFGRAPQFRLSHTFKSEAVDFEIAIAASKPPQRDAGTPDGQAGLRTTVNGWKGLHTANSTGTAIDGLTLGVSGVVRRFAVPEFTAKPGSQNTAAGYGISVDALLPVIPATETTRGNSLTLTGSFVRGTGISDLYTSLTGGVGFPTLPIPAGAATAPAFAPGIDNGMVTYDKSGALRTIDWHSFLIGLQYYLPPSGKLWVAGNFSQVWSNDVPDVEPKGLKRSRFADANLFLDVGTSVRFGIEYAWFNQLFADEKSATNHRGQFSAFYMF